jgi:D-alanyl-D-alanine carboxypeptidase
VRAIPILVALLALCGAAPAPAQTTRPLALSAEAALLIDPRGEVLFAKNAAGDHAPASLVKLMTIHVACDAIQAGALTWDEPVAISARAAATPRYRMGLRPGEQVPLRTLLEAVGQASANDAATAVAEHVAGSEEAFVALMNARAEALGMTGTRFANPHGLPDPHQRTTAKDIATLTDHLMQAHPEARHLLGGGGFVYRGRTFQRNIPLFQNPGGVQALKTGYTREAGYNLAVEAYRSGERFLLVVLGADSRSNSFRDAHALLRFGYAALGLEAPPVVVKARPTTASVKKPVQRRPVRAKIRPAR